MISNFSRSQDPLSRSLRSVWSLSTQIKHHERWPPLVPIARGDEMRLYRLHGNRSLDAVNSWWGDLFGHANARISAALADQLGRRERVIVAGFNRQPVMLLSERLSVLSWLSHCFCGSDGASAGEIARKMSFHCCKNRGRLEKTGFVSLKDGYRAETAGGIVGCRCPLDSRYLCGVVEAEHAALLMGLAQRASRGKRRRCCTSCAKCLRDLSRRKTWAGASPDRRTAGSGCGRHGPMHHARLLPEARTLCDRYGVHLIALGFGRTGSFPACEQAGIRPDFARLSKGITGGCRPLSVTMADDDIYGAFYDAEMARGVPHSHSYTGIIRAFDIETSGSTVRARESAGHQRKNSARTARLA